MRRLIAGMKISVDGKIEAEGAAHWVQVWSEDYRLTPQIDACLLGGGMYTGYEWCWTSIQNKPGKPVWIVGGAPTPAEIEWACFAGGPRIMCRVGALTRPSREDIARKESAGKASTLRRSWKRS
ncbi:MAG TPA: hypothetical protein VJY34_14880 [Roseiarcus sp.]|nr:hypothetical protein [Roseiarcus sp.]